MNTKLHAICDSNGRPFSFFVSVGQVSSHIGARALLSSLPDVDWLLGDRASGLRRRLVLRSVARQRDPRLHPGQETRKATVKYDKRRYARRNRIEIMFGRLKDWRRNATRYDRCPKALSPPSRSPDGEHEYPNPTCRLSLWTRD
ncbi:transposase [Pseudooceanicola sp. 502str34]